MTIILWDDNIDKYFARPLDPLFQQITYLDYFRNYSIFTKSTNSTNPEIYKDQLNNFVILQLLLDFDTWRLMMGCRFSINNCFAHCLVNLKKNYSVNFQLTVNIIYI